METVLTRIPVAEQLKWRRWMHQHAEVSFEEFETTAYIENLLRDVTWVNHCQALTNWFSRNVARWSPRQDSCLTCRHRCPTDGRVSRC